jgi:hypothetical protein
MKKGGKDERGEREEKRLMRRRGTERERGNQPTQREREREERYR